MNANVQRRWDQFLGRRDRMLAGLASWQTEELRKRPPSGGWCALEVVDHLVRTDGEVVRMMDEARVARQRVGAGDRVRAWGVLAVMWLPTRVAMPKPVAPKITPVLTDDLAALQQAWHATDAALLERMAALSDAEQRLGIARHPVSGWLDAGSGIRFLESHLVHHTYQVARIRKAID